MTLSLSRAFAGLLLTTGIASAQLAPTGMNVYYETAPAEHVAISVQVQGASGPFFAVYLAFGGESFHFNKTWLMGYAELDAQGGGTFSFSAPEALIDSFNRPVHFAAAYNTDAGIVIDEIAASEVFGVGAPECVTLDFNHTLGDDSVMVAGRIITEQWADIGLHISADNNNGGHPNKAILFDSGNRTGGDFDLATPQVGPIGNDTALGNLLILAENDGDSNPVDGLIDVPDDESDGGSLIFDFDEPTTLCAVTLIDIDEEPGTELRFYRNGDLMNADVVIPMISLGDGSVQTVNFFETEVDRFEVYFQGSGGVGPLDLIPCPRILNFNEDSVGRPIEFSTGEWITNQYAFLGVTISAENFGSRGEPQQNHPDKAILFDSGNPTGGDPDLLTPNPMVPGNDEALGFVLIVAEDDIDVAPADGLVDDPDDEAGGGEIEFAFDYDVTILSTRVLDVDADELDELFFYDASDMLISSIVVPDMPDGSVQLIDVNLSGVRRVVLALGGSGAITRLRFCPDPVDVTTGD
ncbi:MAG: hypothetical protein DHS20C15_05280 [Planctomycetota bacterium]|nr:MAG: hypothetical protein DHS20C15_05280 [Planctomycetota bacterium]